METRIISIHTSKALVERLDEEAKLLERSRNWVINEAIETLLEHHASVRRKELDERVAAMKKKKAGTR
jgi:predicted transcriptional regulator